MYFLTIEEIAFLPELKKADELLKDFDWKKLDTSETFEAMFLMNLERFEGKDTISSYKDMSKDSKGLMELIDKLNGQDINAEGCFEWIVRNYIKLIDIIKKIPIQNNKEFRKITENWQVSMDVL